MMKYGVMPMPPMPEPLCAGCGSKLSSDTLKNVLRKLDIRKGPGVVLGVEDGEDTALVTYSHNGQNGDGVALTVDQFKTLPFDPFTAGVIAAVNAASDLYAKGIQPQYAMAMVNLKKYSAVLGEDFLFHFLAGAQKIFTAEGIQLVGGQTLECEESQMGFSMSGVAPQMAFWKKIGGQPGDQLLLTKPLGTGVLLTAAMSWAVSGKDLERAVQVMSQSQRAAIQILKTLDPHAVTDVSGFGLLGHLSEMLSNGLGATLHWKSVPILDGALKMRKKGYQSRMASLNFRGFGNNLKGQVDENLSNGLSLVYDPQTSGGLLIALPPTRAQEGLARLRVHYPQASIIGKLEAGQGIWFSAD